MSNLDRKEFLKILGISSLSLLSSNILSKNLPQETLSNKPFRVAHLTDVHIENTDVSKHGFISCLEKVNSLQNKPDIIINGGDAIMNSALTFSKEKVQEQWTLFQNLLSSNNSIPVNHCIGNHDLYGWPFSVSLESESKK
jgi:predicted MPP superfamily phosphohydrolase